MGAGGMTGGAAGGAGARGGGRLPAGRALDLGRKMTSDRRLRIRWDNVPIKGEKPLPYETAFEWVRSVDKRPLLVMRDCEFCGDEDAAILHRTAINDKTILLSHFFHCVKVGRFVTKKNHVLHNLFGARNAPHLFLCTWDGKTKIKFNGRQPQQELWSAMAKILRKEYRKNAGAAVRSWLRILDKFDTLDSRYEDLMLQVKLQGARKRDDRVAALRGKLAKLDEERQRLQLAERKLVAIGLKREPKKTLAGFDDEAAAMVETSRTGGLLEKVRKKTDKDK